MAQKAAQRVPELPSYGSFRIFHVFWKMRVLSDLVKIAIA